MSPPFLPSFYRSCILKQIGVDFGDELPPGDQSHERAPRERLQPRSGFLCDPDRRKTSRVNPKESVMKNRSRMFKALLGVGSLLFVFALVDRAVAQTCTPAPSGLAGWWPGDGNAVDIQGANNGTLMNGATFTTGEVGQAFSLDGVDDYVSVPGTWGGGPEATIDAWVQTSAATEDFQAIVSSTELGEFVHLQLFNDGNIVAYTDGGSLFMPIVLQTPTNVYRHIAFSIKSGDSRLYVDGQLVGTNTLTFA